jgi:hypothetical protein
MGPFTHTFSCFGVTLNTVRIHTQTVEKEEENNKVKKDLIMLCN